MYPADAREAGMARKKAGRRAKGTGGLSQRKSTGLWIAQVELEPGPDGKRRHKSVARKSKKDAARELEAMLEEIRVHGAPLDRAKTVAQVADAWLEARVREVDPKTYSGYETAVARVKTVIGPKPAHRLRPSDVRAVRDAVFDEARAALPGSRMGNGLRTAQMAHRALKLMLDWAVGERICAVNVAAKVPPPKLKDEDAPAGRDALPPAAVVALLRAAGDIRDARHWWRLLTGARQGEILGARLKDVDFGAATWLVDWQLQELPRAHGCGKGLDGKPSCGKTYPRMCPKKKWRVPDGYGMEQISGRWHWVRPKSKRGKTVPLIPALVEVVKRWRAWVDAQGWPNPHGLLFHDKAGMPVTPKADQDSWRALLLKAGLISEAEAKPGGTKLTGHVARHTLVTALAETGVPYDMIGEIVGHDAEIARKIYSHRSAESKGEAMAGLSEVWREALAPAPKEIGAA
jgi:integrase